MSLTDPDARNRRVASFLLPAAWVLALLALLTGPLFFSISVSVPHAGDYAALFFIGYVFLTVGFGLMLYYTTPHRNGMGIAAYVIAYVGGLILVMGGAASGTTADQVATLRVGGVVYLVAIILLVVYIVRTLNAHQTLQDGVETTATVTSAGINGMVNYVQHWKLTLKFTDQAGKDRWFHIGRTGLGYEVGQQFTIKYNPKRPGSRFGIVVLNG